MGIDEEIDEEMEEEMDGEMNDEMNGVMVIKMMRIAGMLTSEMGTVPAMPTGKPWS